MREYRAKNPPTAEQKVTWAANRAKNKMEKKNNETLEETRIRRANHARLERIRKAKRVQKAIIDKLITELGSDSELTDINSELESEDLPNDYLYSDKEENLYKIYSKEPEDLTLSEQETIISHRDEDEDTWLERKNKLLDKFNKKK